MKGVAEAVVKQMRNIAGINTPQFKVTPPGFLSLLLNNPAPISIANLADVEKGKDRTIKIRYVQRATPDQTSTEDTCDPGREMQYQETTLTCPHFRKISLYVSNEELEAFHDEATQKVSIGDGGATITNELLGRIMVSVNGLLGAIDKDLLSEMTTKWGKNALTDTNAPTPITLSTKDNVTLNDGIVKLITDAQSNEIYGTLLMTGNGAFNALYVANRFQSGTNGDGYKGSAWNGFKWYNDFYSVKTWEPDHFGVIAAGSAGFVDWQNYVNYKAGEIAGSKFFTMPVPVMMETGDLSSLIFDVQLKGLDCPVVIDGVTRDRGWAIYISKHFGLFTMPTDVYSTTDRLKGCNGLLHYAATPA